MHNSRQCDNKRVESFTCWDLNLTRSVDAAWCRPEEEAQLAAATDQASASRSPAAPVAPVESSPEAVDSSPEAVDPTLSPPAPVEAPPVVQSDPIDPPDLSSPHRIDLSADSDQPSSISSIPSALSPKGSPRRLLPALDAVAGLEAADIDMPPKTTTDRELRERAKVPRYDERSDGEKTGPVTPVEKKPARKTSPAKRPKTAARLPRMLTSDEKLVDVHPYNDPSLKALVASGTGPVLEEFKREVAADAAVARARASVEDSPIAPLPHYDCADDFSDVSLSSHTAVINALASQMAYVGVVSQRIIAYPGSAHWDWDTVGRVFDDPACIFTPAYHSRASIVHMASRDSAGNYVLEPMVHEPSTADGQCCIYSIMAHTETSPGQHPEIDTATASDVKWPTPPTLKQRATTLRDDVVKTFDSLFADKLDEAHQTGRAMVGRALALPPDAGADCDAVVRFRNELKKNLSNLSAEASTVFGAGRQQSVRTPTYIAAAVDPTHFHGFSTRGLENDHLIGLLGTGNGMMHLFDKAPAADRRVDWWSSPTVNLLNSRRGPSFVGHWEPVLSAPLLYPLLFNHPNIASDPARCYPAVYAPDVPIYLVPQFSARVFGSAASGAPVDEQSRYVRPGLMVKLVGTSAESMYPPPAISIRAEGEGEGDVDMTADRRKVYLVVSTFIELLPVNETELDTALAIPVASDLIAHIAEARKIGLSSVPRERVLLLSVPMVIANASRDEQTTWLTRLSGRLSSSSSLESAPAPDWRIVDLQEIVTLQDMPRPTEADTFPRVHSERRGPTGGDACAMPEVVRILHPLELSPTLMRVAAEYLDHETRFFDRVKGLNAGIEEFSAKAAKSVPVCLLLKWQTHVYSYPDNFPIDLTTVSQMLMGDTPNQHADRSKWLNGNLIDSLSVPELSAIEIASTKKKPAATPTPTKKHPKTELAQLLGTLTKGDLEDVPVWERPSSPPEDVQAALHEWKSKSPLVEVSGTEYRTLFAGCLAEDHLLHRLWKHMASVLRKPKPKPPTWDDYMPIETAGDSAETFRNISSIGSAGHHYLAKYDPQVWLLAQVQSKDVVHQKLKQPGQPFRRDLPSVNQQSRNSVGRSRRSLTILSLACLFPRQILASAAAIPLDEADLERGDAGRGGKPRPGVEAVEPFFEVVEDCESTIDADGGE
jgi:hypothetical protein